MGETQAAMAKTIIITSKGPSLLFSQAVTAKSEHYIVIFKEDTLKGSNFSGMHSFLNAISCFTRNTIVQ